MSESYSIDLCPKLTARMSAPELRYRRRPTRHEPGDVLQVEIEGLWPVVRGEAELGLESFLGGGFAGQVYRARLRRLTLAEGAIPGLQVGASYAVKILIPPTRGARRFRDALFRLAFQGPFSAQIQREAFRAGLLWQKICRRSAHARFGRATAVKDAYAVFFDPILGSWGEITEWVEGRAWRLETDPDLRRRRPWRSVDPAASASGEYLAKRQFMANLVELLREMGGREFGREYAWWTLKSQPNVLKRTDVNEPGPGGGLCAIDFRAGLALLPFFPMSPGDVPLILEGLFRRGRWVQFDRIDVPRLKAFVARNRETLSDLDPWVAEFERMDRGYRRSLPDITGQGRDLAIDADLRCSVRAGLVEGYAAAGLTDDAFARRLLRSPVRFAGFYLLGAIPLAGRILRRAWGNRAWRRHVGQQIVSRSYRRTAFTARAAAELVDWHRAGRIGPDRARFLADRPIRFLIERFTLGLLPFSRIHRALAEPRWLATRIGAFFRFLHSFLTSETYREDWFLSEIEQGRKGGMLTDDEAEEIRAHVRDPFIVKYLKCLGVHFATLPLTQVVSVLLAALAAGWVWAQGRGWEQAGLAFGGVLLLFQVLPLSPGSIARGLFVVVLMIRERNVRDYVIAAPLSFVKYIGYLAFPLQMTASYPKLSRFMAALWATRAVRMIPVFGERGALLEHAVFDLFYNIPQAVSRGFRPRARRLLSAWLGLGLGLILWDAMRRGFSPADRAQVNLWIALLVFFVLPRALLPLLRHRASPPDASRSAE